MAQDPDPRPPQDSDPNGTGHAHDVKRQSTADGQQVDTDWWTFAVVYQVYLRSFADSDADGNGDIAGLTDRLPYIRDLGVDAIWLTPWYPSPKVDNGYDVSDYRDIDPMFGNLTQAQELIDAVHDHGMRLILDLVANHTSDQHPWFQAALATPDGSPDRDRYHFRDGRGPNGDTPPNDWISAFGGIAWTRTTRPDGTPGQWYLHLFAPEQPDLNWDNPEVRVEFESILRYWFDRGVDGMRLDAASALAKAPGLPDYGLSTSDRFDAAAWVDAPMWDVNAVHDILRSFRRVADSYPEPRMLVGEVGANRPDRFAAYLRPDELHTAFNIQFTKAPWEASALRRVIDHSLSASSSVSGLPTWVLSTHDETRHVTRFSPEVPKDQPTLLDPARILDLEVGTRRARAAILLMLALPGGAYLYQGEELGLPEAFIPDERIQDPVFFRTGGALRGRDGCRAPIPWSGDGPPYGFSGRRGQPWLPQPEDWPSLTVEAELGDPQSMLWLYRSALRIRKDTPGFHVGDLTWRDAPDGVLAFDRGSGARCVVNLSTEPVRLDPELQLLVSSTPLQDNALPPDAAAWLADTGA
jgi:alpha-glucosidase